MNEYNEIDVIEDEKDEYGYTFIDEREAYELYDDMLNDCYPMVKFGYLEYLPSQVLKEVDPIAYRCGFHDFLDSAELVLR